MIGNVTYAVVVDGQVRASGLTRRRFQLPMRGLGDGVHHIELIATDDGGQETVSRESDLKVTRTRRW